MWQLLANALVWDQKMNAAHQRHRVFPTSLSEKVIFLTAWSVMSVPHALAVFNRSLIEQLMLQQNKDPTDPRFENMKPTLQFLHLFTLLFEVSRSSEPVRKDSDIQHLHDQFAKIQN